MRAQGGREPSPRSCSTSYYTLSEIFAGLPNVETTSFTDSFIKFGLANAPWLTMPWLVLWWGQQRLREQVARPDEN
jgi:hypothetical protein